MQPVWNGDTRDRVKWGALFHLAHKGRLSPIIQVAYLRDRTKRNLYIGSDERRARVPKAVWDYFSDLHNIERLGSAMGTPVVVFDAPFNHEKRKEYVQEAIRSLGVYPGPKLVFLDPDTGIMRDSSAGPKHATMGDIEEFWEAMSPGDVLAVYQHASHASHWRDTRRQQFSFACNRAPAAAIWSPMIAKDVAVLWTRKRGAGRVRSVLTSVEP